MLVMCCWPFQLTVFSDTYPPFSLVLFFFFWERERTFGERAGGTEGSATPIGVGVCWLSSRSIPTGMCMNLADRRIVRSILRSQCQCENSWCTTCLVERLTAAELVDQLQGPALDMLSANGRRRGILGSWGEQLALWAGVSITGSPPAHQSRAKWFSPKTLETD